MAITQLTTRQLGAASVNRDDLDITTTTKAVAVKIIAGTNVTISSTGVDAGTGDVTINAGSSNIAANTVVGNPTSSTAVSTAMSIETTLNLLQVYAKTIAFRQMNFIF